MSENRSVTPRRGRAVTPQKTWREKVSPERVRFLEAFQQAAKKSKPPDPEILDLLGWMQEIVKSQSRFPEEPGADGARKVFLQPAFVKFAKAAKFPGHETMSPGECELPGGFAQMLQFVQPLVLMLEGDATDRAHVYFALGLLYRLCLPFWQRLRREQYGADELTADNIRSLTAIVSADIKRPHYCRFCVWKSRWARAGDTQIHRRGQYADVARLGNAAMTTGGVVSR
jgi:hypothetical protein